MKNNLNESKRAYYFITVNKYALCFNDIEKILREEVTKDTKLEYSYILHEPDDENRNTHYHIVLHYSSNSNKRFSTVQNIFPGGNVQPSTKERYESSIQYLIHLNHPDKKRYNSNDVQSNLGQERLDKILGKRKFKFQYFDVNKTMDYIENFYNQFGKVSIFQFVKVFGLPAINRYYYSINNLCTQYNNEKNNESLSYI